MAIYEQTTGPDIRPSLLLDFANSKSLDPRITFSRSSTATYYDGKTMAKAEENLQVRSQEFDNSAWILGNASVTANAATAPDGTTTADKLIADTNTGYHYISDNLTTAAGIYTASVYLKSAGYDYAAIRIVNDSFANDRYSVLIDLTDGSFVDSYTVGSPSYTPSYSITDVGNDWYRLSVTIEHYTGYINFSIFMNDDNTPAWASTALPTFTGDGSSGIYIWGAQLEKRSSATAYTPTTSYPITNYIPVLQTATAGTPRFDHDPVTRESKGLLIEEQRTNLFTYSEDFNNSVWDKINGNLISNTMVAPDGAITADEFTADGGSYSRLRYSGTNTSGNKYTFSCHVKAGTTDYVGVVYTSLSAWDCYIQVDLTDGSVISAGNFSGQSAYESSTVSSVGNDWYRISVTYTATDTTPFLHIIPTTSSSWSGLSSAPAAGTGSIYAWGAQLEAGAFLTSYIPTSGSTVTRSADSASMTGGNFVDVFSSYNGNGVTIYTQLGDEGNFNAQISYPRLWSLSDTSTENYFEIYGQQTSGGLRYRGNLNNTAVIGPLNVGGISSNSKVAVRLKPNDFAIQADDLSVATDTSCQLNSFTTFKIGLQYDGANPLNGTIKKIAVYSAGLTNAQLKAMTES